MIQGYFISIQKGNEAERVAIGFGKGESELKTAVEGFQMTATGLRKLGSGDLNAGGGKSPGAALGVAGLIATHNPAGLIISGGMHVYGEESGSSKVEGRAKQTAKEIADRSSSDSSNRAGSIDSFMNRAGRMSGGWPAHSRAKQKLKLDATNAKPMAV